MSDKKILIISALLIATLYVMWFGYMGMPNPLKITDPRSPSFNRYNFRFEDYLRKNELHENLPLILEKGLFKEEVDKILIDSGGAFSWNISNDKIFNRSIYCYTPSLYETVQSLRYMSDMMARDISVDYDADNKINSIWVGNTLASNCSRMKERK